MKRNMKTSESTMVCSKDFAEWLLKQAIQDGPAEATWLDLILKYCNAAYDELINEELRKANQFFYKIKEEENCFRIIPSYELVKLNAVDPADRAHIVPMTEFCDGYSVLTTGAAFPGKQQFPFWPSDSWRLSYLIEECVFQGEKMMSPANRAEGKEEQVMEDQYSYWEFISACEYQFIDNQFPYSFGPSCPDRILSMSTYHNIVRCAALDCADICERRGLNERYQEIFIAVLARTILLHSCDNDHQYDDINTVITLARKTYKGFIEETSEGTDLDDYCRKIRAFLNTRVKAVMKCPDKKTEEGRARVRDIAVAHRDTVSGYRLRRQHAYI